MQSTPRPMAMRLAIVAPTLLGTLIGFAVAMPAAPPEWNFNPLGWTSEADGFLAEGPAGFAVRRDVPRCGRLRVEATVRVERSVGPRWKVAGIGVFDDPGNYWHLALVEAPDDEGARRFIELCQMRDGHWLSQNNLQCSRRDMGRSWQDGKDYRLTLSIDPKGIEGQVTGADGAARNERHLPSFPHLAGDLCGERLHHWHVQPPVGTGNGAGADLDDHPLRGGQDAAGLIRVHRCPSVVLRTPSPLPRRAAAFHC